MGPVSTIHSKSRKTVLTTLCLISVANLDAVSELQEPVSFVIGLGSAVSLFDLSTFWRDE
jgi:hypothetical protein